MRKTKRFTLLIVVGTYAKCNFTYCMYCTQTKPKLNLKSYRNIFG